MPKAPFLNGRTIFYVTLWIIGLTTMGVWLFGLRQHNSVFTNALLSTSILATAFFIFLTTGLYVGIRWKDNMSTLREKLSNQRFPNLGDLANGADEIDAGDGIGGLIVSVVLWLVAGVLIWLFLWLFGVVLWTAVIAFMAMLYWVFFRAIRHVFKRSAACKNRFWLSAGYGLYYTMLYMGWVYLVIGGLYLVLEVT